MPCERALSRRIDGLLRDHPRVIVAVDGGSAAGKTTLAARLRERYGCNVLHMDHFFLRPEQRTAERLARPGGHADVERFQAEVLRPLRAGLALSYRPYDCGRQALGPPITVTPRPVNIVEGVYSCHPLLWDTYDLRVFLCVDPEAQRRRILTRDGPVKARRFRDEWIPMETAYFAAFDLKRRCEFSLTFRP